MAAIKNDRRVVALALARRPSPLARRRVVAACSSDNNSNPPPRRRTTTSRPAPARRDRRRRRRRPPRRRATTAPRPTRTEERGHPRRAQACLIEAAGAARSARRTRCWSCTPQTNREFLNQCAAPASRALPFDNSRGCPDTTAARCPRSTSEPTVSLRITAAASLSRSPRLAAPCIARAEPGAARPLRRAPAAPQRRRRGPALASALRRASGRSCAGRAGGPPRGSSPAASAPPALRAATSAADPRRVRATSPRSARDVDGTRGEAAALEPSLADRPRATRPSTPTTSFDASPWSRVWPRGLRPRRLRPGRSTSRASSRRTSSTRTARRSTRTASSCAARACASTAGWDFASATLEIDGNNNNGLAFGLRRAEASLLLRAADPSAPPLLVVHRRAVRHPLRLRALRARTDRASSSSGRPPRARSSPATTTSARRSPARVGFFRYAVGRHRRHARARQRAQRPRASTRPPRRTSSARFGAETAAERRPRRRRGRLVRARARASTPGTPATKATFQWQDLNGNGVVDPGETVGVPGQAATPSKTFRRWALGVDLQLRLRTPIGRGMLYGEAYVGQQLRPRALRRRSRRDRRRPARGRLVRRPTCRRSRATASSASASTRTTRTATRPRSSAGSVLPLDQTITTWSPLVGPRPARPRAPRLRVRPHPRPPGPRRARRADRPARTTSGPCACRWRCDAARPPSPSRGASLASLLAACVLVRRASTSSSDRGARWSRSASRRAQFIPASLPGPPGARRVGGRRTRRDPAR